MVGEGLWRREFQDVLKIARRPDGLSQAWSRVEALVQGQRTLADRLEVVNAWHRLDPRPVPFPADLLSTGWTHEKVVEESLELARTEDARWAPGALGLLAAEARAPDVARSLPLVVDLAKSAEPGTQSSAIRCLVRLADLDPERVAPVLDALWASQSRRQRLAAVHLIGTAAGRPNLARHLDRALKFLVDSKDEHRHESLAALSDLPLVWREPKAEEVAQIVHLLERVQGANVDGATRRSALPHAERLGRNLQSTNAARDALRPLLEGFRGPPVGGEHVGCAELWAWGDWLLETGEARLALPVFERAVQLADTGMMDASGGADALLEILWGHHRVGDARLALGDPDGALKAYETARFVAEELTAASGDDPDAWTLSAETRRGALALAYVKVGDALLALNRPDEAWGSYHFGQTMLDRMDPRGFTSEDILRLAAAHRRIGDALVASGRPGEALASFEIGLMILGADGRESAFPAEVARVRKHMGDALLALGRYPEALAMHRAAIVALADIVQREPGRLALAADLVDMGLDVVRRLDPVDPESREFCCGTLVRGRRILRTVRTAWRLAPLQGQLLERHERLLRGLTAG